MGHGHAKQAHTCYLLVKAKGDSRQWKFYQVFDVWKHKYEYCVHSNQMHLCPVHGERMLHLHSQMRPCEQCTHVLSMGRTGCARRRRNIAAHRRRLLPRSTRRCATRPPRACLLSASAGDGIRIAAPGAIRIVATVPRAAAGAACIAGAKCIRSWHALSPICLKKLGDSARLTLSVTFDGLAR